MIHITLKSPLTPAIRNKAYSATFTATGGTAPYTWTVISGAVPAGLALASNGVLSGTPTTDGNSTFEVQVTDTPGVSMVGEFELAVEEALQPTPPSPTPPGTGLTEVDILVKLPVINGYVAVPDEANNLRVPLTTAFSVIPGATLGLFLGRQFFVFPEFERTHGYPADWYAQLRAVATVF